MTAGEIGQPVGKQRSGGNDWLWRAPYQSPVNERLGRLQYVQANDPVNDTYSGQPINAAVPIYPQVVPWPFATDDAGAAFDMTSLWGIKFACHNPEVYDLIAVPRGLPSGYTLALPRSSWQSSGPSPGGAFSYYSDDNKATWKSTGSPPSAYNWTRRAAPNRDDIIHKWGPMNYANKSIPVSTFLSNDIFKLEHLRCWHRDFNDPPFPDEPTQYVVPDLIATDHIGFRRIKVTTTNQSTADSYVLKVCIVPVGITVVVDDYPFPLGPNMVKYPTDVTVIGTITVPPGTGDAAVTTDHYLDNMIVPTLGTRMDFYLVMDNTGSHTLGNVAFPYLTLQSWLSPRVDVPLWFHVTGPQAGTSDWHAPGGYIP